MIYTLATGSIPPLSERRRRRKKMEEMQSGDKDYLMRHQNGAVSLFSLSMGLRVEGGEHETNLELGKSFLVRIEF
jgi:hypothetical protein